MSKTYFKKIARIVQKNKMVFKVLKGFKMLIFGMKREYIVLDDKKLIYLMNAKVANSSIKATFLDGVIADNGLVHGKMEKMKKTLNKNEMDYFIFTFVRNPYDRLVSCYENKYHGEQKNKKNTHKIKGWFDNYLFGYMKKDNGFEAFVDNVVKIPDRLADRHFRSQHYLIYGRGNKVKLNLIGHYENINTEYVRLTEEFELRELPHFNASKKKDYRTYYTEEMAEKVYRRFQKDFEALGYTWAYDDLMSWLSNSEGNEMEI